MKKIICLLLALLLLCSTALAAPRYPSKLGEVTDAAAVLSQSTVKDLVRFAKEVDDETSIDFYVVTVDFLDGESLEDYAAALRDQWNLHGNDLMLLIAVGEDKFGTFGGEGFDRKVSPQVQEKLLNTHFAGPFLQQNYNEAIAQYIPALATEINKAYDENIKLNGLFGHTEAPVVNWAEEWSQRWNEANVKVHTDVKVKTGLERVTEEDKDTGFSLGKVILTVFLLMVIFGKKDRRGRNGCGCGCAPFSSILAALGLWKLWDNE